MKPFKAYDIRGIYPDDVNEELAYNVGRAFVVFLKCKKVAVAYDMRASSKSLFESLVKGITDQGADVVDIGFVPTPLLNFSVAHYDFDAGIMISASHNPGNYNAFKLIRKPAIQISSDTGMDEIEKLARAGKFPEAEKGKVSEKGVMDDYINFILPKFKEIKKLKIAADYGNGMGAVSARPAFEKLGLNVVELYPEPDPNFPNHEANPHELVNFRDLQEAVKREKADIGIFFDGDADRSQIVDENGEIILPDIMFAAVMEDELPSHKGENVYYDLRFTKSAEDAIKNSGGVPIMVRVGNPFYKEKLMTLGGHAAAEFSGHIMYSENYGIDDGLFAALKVINLMSKKGKKLSEIVKPLIKYSTTPEININVEGKDTDEILEKVEDAFPDGNHIEIDGVYVEYDDWWFSLRKSNTEPLVRLRVEAGTEQMMNEKKEQILGIINS